MVNSLIHSYHPPSTLFSAFLCCIVFLFSFSNFKISIVDVNFFLDPIFFFCFFPLPTEIQ